MAEKGGCPCSWNGNCSKHNNIGDIKLDNITPKVKLVKKETTKKLKQPAVNGGCPCSWNGDCSKHNNYNNIKVDNSSSIIMDEQRTGGCPCSWNGNCVKHNNNNIPSSILHPIKQIEFSNQTTTTTTTPLLTLAQLPSKTPEN